MKKRAKGFSGIEAIPGRVKERLVLRKESSHSENLFKTSRKLVKSIGSWALPKEILIQEAWHGLIELHFKLSIPPDSEL